MIVRAAAVPMLCHMLDIFLIWERATLSYRLNGFVGLVLIVIVVPATAFRIVDHLAKLRLYTSSLLQEFVVVVHVSIAPSICVGAAEASARLVLTEELPQKVIFS